MSQAKWKSPRSFFWAKVLLLGSFTLSTLLHCYFFLMLLLFLSPDSVPFIRLLWEEYVHSFVFYFTESQNHYVKKDLLRFFILGHPQWVSQNRSSFKYFIIKDFIVSLGNLCHCSTTLIWKNKCSEGTYFFLMCSPCLFSCEWMLLSLSFTLPPTDSSTHGWDTLSMLNIPNFPMSLICHHMNVFQASP